MENFVYFLNGISNDLEFHYKEKEYRNDIIVEISGRYFEVYFFTKNALEYEMRSDGFFSLPGIIVLDEISYDKIMKSISYLINLKYFDLFQGYFELPTNRTFMHKWYQNELIFTAKNQVKIPVT